ALCSTPARRQTPSGGARNVYSPQCGSYGPINRTRGGPWLLTSIRFLYLIPCVSLSSEAQGLGARHTNATNVPSSVVLELARHRRRSRERVKSVSAAPTAAERCVPRRRAQLRGPSRAGDCADARRRDRLGSIVIVMIAMVMVAVIAIAVLVVVIAAVVAVVITVIVPVVVI